MKIYNKNKVIFTASQSIPNYSEDVFGVDSFFNRIMDLFPQHEQIRQLSDNLLIVVGSGQDTVLLDVEYE